MFYTTIECLYLYIILVGLTGDLTAKLQALDILFPVIPQQKSHKHTKGRDTLMFSRIRVFTKRRQVRVKCEEMQAKRWISFFARAR